MSPPAVPGYKSEYSLKYDTRTSLNTYDVHIPTTNGSEDSSKTKYWIVYLHGGAWRDPLQTSLNILPTLAHLSPSTYPIAGVLSLNYSLSAHGDHPTDPSLPGDPARNAVHPEHIEDVLAGIRCVQRKHGFGANYILAGHSCGATLAYQAVMGVWRPRKAEAEAEAGIERPVGVVGVEGIYDLGKLLETHAEIPLYRSFLETAFGMDQGGWKAASPVAAKLRESWKEGKVAVLAQSTEDELVDWVQTERMSERLWGENREGRRDVVVKLLGKHYEVVTGGVELAKAVAKALEMLGEVGK